MLIAKIFVEYLVHLGDQEEADAFTSGYQTQPNFSFEFTTAASIPQRLDSTDISFNFGQSEDLLLEFDPE